jgi:hypothetical protein
MKNIHEAATLQEFIERINKLRPDAQRHWGKMTVAQMLAHCATALEVNVGDRVSKQGLMGKLFGRIAKKSVVSAEPFKQGLPTDPSFVQKEDKDFEQEKARLLALLKRLSASDPHALAKNPHPFFGKMTAEEWNTLNFKHLDHHLRQFGV